MAPRTRRTTTTTPSATMTPAEIQQAIADGINAALAEQAATRFQSDFLGIFNLDRKETEILVSSQHETLITELEEGIKILEPSKHILETMHATIVTQSADVVVKEAGIINSVTEEKIPMLAGISLSARFVKLEGNAMLAPTYTADGSVVLSYVSKGSVHERLMDTKVEEGDLIIVPPFFAAAEIADVGGMELFSVVPPQCEPIMGKLAGNISFWNSSSPLVLQSALNINPELTERYNDLGPSDGYGC
ncbi:11-S seed storage protein, RmlC-like cupin domain, RmlC-like jelly roll fold protein [Artemisia annua]|uniref:11-S seed storage protein, RmlC-like cupin domain, RmlC-like jelly roll fold protein n=1 Tax=Artemisia annua TaxID=35608 RepID=A0A2U1QNY8_ARTAN|nr:11-S seed storage protein, RmlC-like cupin domain, RmlC-like jelly roll fold protein [Artemisia annua]